jgi:CheY-like chemotaxis protein
MNKTRVLIVDDHLPVAKLVASQLEKTGAYTVQVESMPNAAVQVAREFKPDVFLLDVEMPGMNGMELSAKLAADATLASIPIIFLTSLVSEDEAGKREMISNGRRYLAKTASVETMSGCISRALRTAAVSKPAA